MTDIGTDKDQPAAQDLRNAIAMLDWRGKHSMERAVELIRAALVKLGEPNAAAIHVAKRMIETAPLGLEPREVTDREARDLAAVILRAAVEGLDPSHKES